MFFCCQTSGGNLLQLLFIFVSFSIFCFLRCFMLLYWLKGMGWSGTMEWNGVEWTLVESLLVIFWSKKRHFKMSFSRAGFVSTKNEFFSNKKKKSPAGRSINTFFLNDFFKFFRPSILGRWRRKSGKLAVISKNDQNDLNESSKHSKSDDALITSRFLGHTSRSPIEAGIPAWR